MKKFFSIIMLIIVLIIIWSSKTFAINPSNNEIYEGIDVSKWQGTINFEEVANDGIDIVYIKATQGTTYVSPTFEEQYTNAKNNGLKIGFYHYVTARTIEEARNEAQFFASKISGKQIDCKLAMDFEEFGNLSQEEINAIGLEFVRRLEELTNKPVIIYSNTYAARTIWNGEITKYPLWVAEYGVSKPRDNGKWNSYVGWQYTNMGNIKGINGNVDRDKFTKDIFINENMTPGEIIPEIPKPESSYKTITILRGDTLTKIAKEYGTTVNELARINNIQNINLIYAGRTLRVPVSNSQENSNLEEIVYIVKKGDTLSEIAMKYNVRVNEIARENQIKNVNLIYPGQRLIIKTEAMGTELGHLCYKVVRGDTLYSISRRFNVPIASIVMLNRIQNPNLIYPGQCLKINR